MRSVYDSIKAVQSIRPVTQAAGTVNGNAIDCLGYNSVMLSFEEGAITGTPATAAVDCKVQDSADGSTGWNDVSGASITQQTSTTGNKSAQIRVEGVNLNTKRYLRAVVTVAFTGGSSPAAPISAVALLGKAYRAPVGNQSVGA